ncbi:MAG: DASS family sodium-coupled anion symporter [Candidatus Manganitrophus sp.]|nr:DASS family sodium-coupled anion symporter [Candidatus Manganitrophus sp.]MDC4225146.1 DASS family sodium-coupled anion symporter [Candidatus Manganitrophus sp.]WDT69406.1 MAG: DASS family sodium-coupled anion symporter [Candidatus Manganitrophus sp.]
MSELLKRKWIFIGLAVGFVMLMIPVPEGLTPVGMKALALVVVAFIFFMTEPVPLPGVALFIAVSQVLLGLEKPTGVAQSFMSDSVFFIMGSLMIAAAIVKQNLDKRIALAIVRLTGPRIERIVLGLVSVSAVIASFIGEHTVSAMMLPVGVALIKFTSDDRKKVKNLSILLMLSIAYGAMIAAIGTPSGGARNAIMLAYWKELFGLNLTYFQWVVAAYPIILLEIPFVAYLLYRSFSPEVKDLSPAISALRAKVEEEGKLTRQDWVTIGIFLITVVMWMTISDQIGLGITALIGVLLFMVAGVVRWEDLNNNVNWGTILVYGGAISLGIMMKQSGVAEWIAKSFLTWVEPIGIHQGVPLLAAMSLLTVVLSSFMSSGATVGMLGPITLQIASLSGTSIVQAGFVTVISTSFVYLTSVASPACNIIYGGGYLNRTDFLKAGWKLVLVSFLLLLLISAGYWRMLGI